LTDSPAQHVSVAALTALLDNRQTQMAHALELQTMLAQPAMEASVG
jgi:hypothetical protein